MNLPWQLKVVALADLVARGASQRAAVVFGIAQGPPATVGIFIATFQYPVEIVRLAAPTATMEELCALHREWVHAAPLDPSPLSPETGLLVSSACAEAARLFWGTVLYGPHGIDVDAEHPDQR